MLPSYEHGFPCHRSFVLPKDLALLQITGTKMDNLTCDVHCLCYFYDFLARQVCAHEGIVAKQL